jgi:glycine betaine/proline transport system substrate-binding protein
MSKLGNERWRPASPLALLAASLLAVVTGLLAAGCGDEGSADPARPSGERVTIGYVGWDESVAVSNLTKVLLEDLGYEQVELRRGEPEAIIRGVASGDLDAFEGVWMPNHEPLLKNLMGDEVQLLNPWLIGTTRSSLATPSYMGVRNLDELEKAGVQKVISVEPGAAPVELPTLSPRYSLERDLYPNTSMMLSEVDRLSKAKRPFVFLAYSPHWINEVYEFDYIEDPNHVLGDLTQPAWLQMVVRKDLREDDPLAYSALEVILLTEHQVHDLELTIRDAKSPQEGAKAWARDNKELIQGWIGAAKARSQNT